MKQPRTNIEKPSFSPAYRQLWRVVDGAVADAFAMHPTYLTDHGRIAARRSIVKRVTGAVLGYATETNKLSFAGQPAKGRSGVEPAVNGAIRREPENPSVSCLPTHEASRPSRGIGAWLAAVVAVASLFRLRLRPHRVIPSRD